MAGNPSTFALYSPTPETRAQKLVSLTIERAGLTGRSNGTPGEFSVVPELPSRVEDAAPARMV